MKLRRLSTKPRAVWGVTLPAELVRACRAKGVEEFDVVTTEDGVLLRPVGRRVPRFESDGTPTWLR